MMDSNYESNCDALRARFEGREAIYMEKGAWRARVTNIRLLRHAARHSRMYQFSHVGTAPSLSVGADVEEIITPGLGVGRTHPPVTSPCRWDIAGDSTTFSDDSWYMGYGGWALHFDPEFVQTVIDFAARRPNNADPFESYNEICELQIDFLIKQKKAQEFRDQTA